jgi:hypothetical protein
VVTQARKRAWTYSSVAPELTATLGEPSCSLVGGELSDGSVGATVTNGSVGGTVLAGKVEESGAEVRIGL